MSASWSGCWTPGGEPWQPVVRDRLPCGCEGGEEPGGGPDSRIRIKDAHAHAIGSLKPGLLLNIAEPQPPQNHFSRPSSGFHARNRSSPARICRLPGAVIALIDAAVPVRRWQRQQWQ